jgi:hypothetical protein
VPTFTVISRRSRRANADHGEVLLLTLLALAALAAAGIVVDARIRAATARMDAEHRPSAGAQTSWLSLPEAPRPVTADDAWVLEAFDSAEIAELRHIDSAVRHDTARAHHAVVLERVPDTRRSRRVRLVRWNGEQHLTLVLADGTSVELDGITTASAIWIAYCQDQFGLVLEEIDQTETAWAARLASCGMDTRVSASRVRVS